MGMRIEAAFDIQGIKAKSKRQKAKSRKEGKRQKMKGERYFLYSLLFTVRLC
jgi:hypothetical protein